MDAWVQRSILKPETAPKNAPTTGQAIQMWRSVLMKKMAKCQVSVYYVSKFLTKVEMNYMEVEKFLYALMVSAMKLRPYFHEHRIIVSTNPPLKHFPQKQYDASGRMIKWAIKLSELQKKKKLLLERQSRVKRWEIS